MTGTEAHTGVGHHPRGDMLGGAVPSVSVSRMETSFMGSNTSCQSSMYSWHICTLTCHGTHIESVIGEEVIECPMMPHLLHSVGLEYCLKRLHR